MGYGPVFAFPGWEKGQGGYKETRNILGNGLKCYYYCNYYYYYSTLSNRKMGNLIAAALDRRGALLSYPFCTEIMFCVHGSCHRFNVMCVEGHLWYTCLQW